MFASNEDIQAWIKEDLVVVNDANASKPNIDAERTVKGQLSGVFSSLVIHSWDSPANTPDQIRGIAGRLAAAYLLRTYLLTESEDVSVYAQNLYNEAIGMLADIRSGAITITDANDDPIDQTGVNLLSFWPDSTVPSKFTMDQEFA